MTCIGDRARQLLKATRKRLAKTKRRSEAIKLFQELENQCLQLVCDAELEFDSERRQLRELEEEMRGLQDERRAGLAEANLCDRIVSGQLKIDDYMLANKRGWPIERLEVLAGVR